MKSAYEIAMARLEKQAPSAPLSQRQKQQLAELDSRYAAQIAGREIALQGKIAAASDPAEAAALREQLVLERQQLQAELTEKKEQVRQERK